MNRQFLVLLCVLFLLTITSCTVAPAEIPPLAPQSTPLSTYTPAPVLTATTKPTTTPIPTITSTHIYSSSPTASPDHCSSSSWGSSWVILTDDVYFSLGPKPREMDERLFNLHPQWRDFRQTVNIDSWSAGIIFDQASFGGPEYGVNPAVLLVTVGMELDWQLPLDGDLYSRAVRVAKELDRFAVEYYTQDEVKAAYPQIGNQATYAVYQFFDEDLDLLETWCRTYQTLFGDNYPLKP